MVDTRIENGVIYHLTNKSVQEGEITGKIDWERRRQLMDHHTAVHIVGGSARVTWVHIFGKLVQIKVDDMQELTLLTTLDFLGMIWIRLKIMQMTSSQRILL